MMNPHDAVIVGYLRTPIGRYGGALAGVRPDSMAAHVIASLVARYGIDPGGALRAAQITPKELWRPGARVTAAQFEALNEHAMQELDDEALGWFTRRLLPILAVLALLGSALLLANDVAGGSNRYSVWYGWVLGLSAAALIVLIAVIAQRVTRLVRDARRDAPGARLARRLLLMLMLLALPPVVVVYGFALNFLNATIDAWFNVRLEQPLDDALELGRFSVEEHLKDAQSKTDALAQALARVGDETLHGPNFIRRALADVIDALQTGREPELSARKALNATEIIVLHDPDAEQSLVVLFFDNEDEYRKGDEILNAMPTGDTPGGRSSVTKYQVAHRMAS